jgi:glycosyltransferase involved in cell wall biosynthesis
VRFLILTQYYPPEVGAPQVRLSSFARQLRRAGHEVTVLTGMPNYPSGVVDPAYRGRMFARESRDGISVIRTWLYATNDARMVPRLASYLSFCLSSLLAFAAVGKQDFVFVESPPLFLGVTGHLLAKLSGARCMLNVSDLWPDTVVEMGMLGPGRALSAAFALERWLYRKADWVVGVTMGIRDRLLEEKQLPASKVLFLPNGADTELFAPRPRDESLAVTLGLGNRKLFLFAGLHGHAQDLPTIVAAANSLRDEPDVLIGFVGGGPVKKWAITESERLGLRNILFVDPQPLEEMPRYWSLATAALVTLRDMPLFDGARPSKSFPPMASAVPVIFSGRGEMRDLLEQAGAGIVVPPEDPAALAGAIRTLADDSARAHELGSNARSLILAQFSWTSIVSEWLKTLEHHMTPQRPEVSFAD